MTTLKISNDYCYLDTEDLDLKTKLWKTLRVRAEGCFHSTAYKKGFWDGYIEFFKLNTGRFLTGLLPDVKTYLDGRKLQYTIQDYRTAPLWTRKSIDKNFLNYTKKKVVLHDYQVNSVNQILEYGRGLVKLPTGAGKTYILVSALKCIPPKSPVLFMTKNAGLVNQNYKAMIEWGIKDVGRWYDKYKEPNYIMCVTAHHKTFESIAKLLPKFKYVFVDEVHECMSDICEELYPKLTSASCRVGISATPFKYGGKDLEHKLKVTGNFNPIFKTDDETGTITTHDLQEKDILSGSDATFYNITEPKNIQHEPYGDAVTLGIANNFFFLDVVKRLVKTLKGRTLILVERKDQGEYMKQLLPNAHWIQGKDKLSIREDVFEMLRKDENAIAIATRHIITAGIDVFLHNLVNAAGGQAEHSVIQQMGRGLRKAGDKEILNYYDFLFQTNEYLTEHSQNRIGTIKKEKHQVIVKDIDF